MSGKEGDAITKGYRGKPKASKVGLQFLVRRIARFLKARKYAECVGVGVPMYFFTVLEYLIA